MTGGVLDIDSHDTANELNIRAEGPERSENGGHRQRGVVEPLPQHLDLHNHINATVAKISENLLLLFCVQT